MARGHQQAPREGTGLNVTTALGTRLRYAIHRGLLPSPGLLPTTLIGISPYLGYPSPFGSYAEHSSSWHGLDIILRRFISLQFYLPFPRSWLPV